MASPIIARAWTAAGTLRTRASAAGAFAKTPVAGALPVQKDIDVGIGSAGLLNETAGGIPASRFNILNHPGLVASPRPWCSIARLNRRVGRRHERIVNETAAARAQ